MADPKALLQRHQSHILSLIRDLGICPDAALVARLAELGVKTERTTLVNYRQGNRAAPMGLLMVILGFVDEPGILLGAIAEQFGLRVVPNIGEAEKTTGNVMFELCDVSSAMGALSGALREALVDDQWEAVEIERVNDLVDELEQQLAELRAAVPDRAGATR